jgi:hypothetical protein
MPGMVRRVMLVGGAALALMGFVLGLSAVALPWLEMDISARIGLVGYVQDRHDSKPLFSLDGGAWFFVVLMFLFLMVLAATLTSGAVARVFGGAGLALAVAGLAVVVAIWPDTEAGSSYVTAFGLAEAETRLSVGFGAILGPVSLVLLGTASILIGLAGGIGDRLRRAVTATIG